MTDKRPKSNNAVTRGGQITFHNLRMLMQIQGSMIAWGIFAVIGLTAVFAYFFIPHGVLKAAYYYVLFHSMSTFVNPDNPVAMTIAGHNYQQPLRVMLNNAHLTRAFTVLFVDIQLYFLLSVAVIASAVFALLRYFKKKGEEQTEDRFIRGVRIAEPHVLAKKLKSQKKASTLKFDGLALFKLHFEVQHMLIDGTTGSGKSVALRKLLRWVKKRGDKAIVYDKGCTFTGVFYEPDTDIILNPFDERCPHWDVWCDAYDAPEFENAADALIPQSGEGDPFWVLAARTIFASTAFKMRDEPDRTNARFLELLLTSELDDLSAYLKGTESNTLVSDKAAKIAISIKSILAAYIKSLRFLEGLDKPDKAGNARPTFSIRDWVQDDKQTGTLFLSSNAYQHASLRPLISMWLSMASTAILGLKENPDRRIWIIMDEMPTLHKLPELASTIAEVRKFGGCYVIGIQSYAQLEKNYGRHAASEMFDLLNTRLYYRSPSHPMAKFSSQDLGEQEVDVSKEQYSYGANTVRDGVSLGHQTITRPAVTATQIMHLDDLECWLKTPGNYPITKLALHYDRFTQIAKPFILRDIHYSDKMEQLEKLRVWQQISAINILGNDERNQLLATFDAGYQEGEEQERKAETDMLTKTVNATSKEAMPPTLDDNPHQKENEAHDKNTVETMFETEHEISASQDYDM